MAKQIDILLVEPGKNPRPAKVEDTLEAFQEVVGGPIEAGCYLPQRVMLVCNSEAVKRGLPPNRANPATPHKFIAGTFLLCSFEGEQLISLNDEQREKFKVYFALPGEEGGTSA